ncbi:MarR family winged helix-turn-helix transcriptional regulator [Acidiphilium acidophilum]|uniref:MarR family transcriptional regulator n=1 Tax=Acidiphilium acidophilum TaxID=76588 RepID=A0AAW9DTK1_ACIAO|nr:MarR family transcriptional regulator [Acidiphilium acidophilum]MDX5931490.1 MarR family transcriptional regulator [Acidiphilium acidophilum]GBQ04870.1 MarR family transcriptional regulator [Acidiphilium acidophilum DSM 700]
MEPDLSCAPPGAEPEPELLYLLHDVARLLRREIDRRARMHDMNRAQWVMLIRLARNPGLSQKDLAEIIEVEPMTVARLTDRLEARGLVERRADPRDRRIWRLHLTDEADPILQDIETHRGAVADFIAADLTPSMIDATTEGLIRMKTSLLKADRAADAYMISAAKAEQEIA